MKLLSIILGLLLPISQGVGGKAGVGGLGGFGTGSPPPPTTVTFGDYCTGGGTSPTTCTWHGAAPAAGKGAFIAIWHSTSTTITTVCDGTGTGGCTGSSTWNSTADYLNAGHFNSQIWYTCNFQGSTSITVTASASVTVYLNGMWFSGQTTTGTNCSDGGAPANAQSTTATQLSTGAISTTNANSLVLGVFSNNCGGTSYTAGNDGQGHAMTESGGQAGASQVVAVEYLQETGTNSYTPNATGGGTCGTGGNGQAVAFK